uniref:Uncharacterized protein n=1 Tax=Rhizophora mucronata TaxID=61149 RepID=A0A2P2Q1G0_RHIMU
MSCSSDLEPNSM